MWAHVKEDGSVDYLGGLPQTWNNVSGLHLSKDDPAYLKTLGWFPLVETNVTPTYNQIFDTDVITVEAERVTLVHRVRDMTSEERTLRDESDMIWLREERDKKLVSSDWTQAPDHSSPLSNAKKTKWATYRQSLRDVPATTDLTTWPDGMVWPTEPS